MSMSSQRSADTAIAPHANQSVLTAGPLPAEAAATLVLLHGRGGSAQDMLGLFSGLGIDDLAAIAPQATAHTWYPNSFLAPISSNQPYLDSALAKVNSIVDGLIVGGVRTDRIALLGFSQGACLTLEFVARHPQRYGAVIGLTGGLIGPPGTPRNYEGSLSGTSVFLGTSDPDPHVPFSRVQETEAVLARMGAEVELRRYPGMPHIINEDELDAARSLIQRVMTARCKGRS